MSARHTRLAALGTVALWLALAAGGLLLKLPAWSATVDIGAEGPLIDLGRGENFHNFFGFQQPEQARDGSGRSFRWTSSEHATLTIPSAQRMQPLLLDMVLCGCRFDGTRPPVTLLVNNTPLATVTAGDQWRRYRLPVPVDLPHPDYSVMVELRAPLWQTAEGRRAGVAVDEITLAQPAPAPLAGLPGTLLLGAGAVLLAWYRRSLAGALRPTLLLGAAWLLVNALYAPQILPRAAVVGALVGGLLALWWLAERLPWPPEALALLALWLALCPQLLGGWVLDDAFISFRYARHLVQGHGLVFNPGEYVEGYTNFLWTMLIAAAMAAGADPVVTTALLNLLLSFAIVLLTVALAGRLVLARWAWVAGLLLAVSTPFLLYTTRNSGMETGLFTALALAALLVLVERRCALAGLLTACTMLTRPDGAIVAAVGGLYVLWVGWSNEGHHAHRARGALHSLLWYGGMLALLYLPYFAWRWNYYGYPLPNTFYAKVGGTWAQAAFGLSYLWDFGREHLLLLTGGGGILVGILAWRGMPRTRWPVVALVGGFLAFYSLYIVLVGGDWMPGARFCVPLLPPLALLTIWGLAGLARRAVVWGTWSGRLLALAGVAALVGVLAWRLPAASSHNPATLIYGEQYVLMRYREAGRWINAHTPPDTLIAVSAAGALPYYAERPTIDILGLNDTYIAHLPGQDLGIGKPGHEKTDPGYVLARQPDIIPRFAVPYVADHPVFLANYRLEKVTGPEGFTVKLYVHRDMALPEDGG